MKFVYNVLKYCAIKGYKTFFAEVVNNYDDNKYSSNYRSNLIYIRPSVLSDSDIAKIANRPHFKIDLGGSIGWTTDKDTTLAQAVIESALNGIDVGYAININMHGDVLSIDNLKTKTTIIDFSATKDKLGSWSYL